jgi:hypothetical protein
MTVRGDRHPAQGYRAVVPVPPVLVHRLVGQPEEGPHVADLERNIALPTLARTESTPTSSSSGSRNAAPIRSLGLVHDGSGRLASRTGFEIRQEHEELVAASAGDEVRLADDGADPRGHVLEHFVADRVPVGVVDRLE